MKNGFHDHFCPKCGHGFSCRKVTHCPDHFEALCPDHMAEAFNPQTDEHEEPKP